MVKTGIKPYPDARDTTVVSYMAAPRGVGSEPRSLLVSAVSRVTERALSVLDAVDRHDPMGVTELARLLSLDKAVVSRLVAMFEAEGWVVRENGKVALGPRSALLGIETPAARLIGRAQQLTHALAGVTGMNAIAVQLVGIHAICIATAPGRDQDYSIKEIGVRDSFPFWERATGRAAASLMEEGDLLRQIGSADTFSSPHGGKTWKRDALMADLSQARAGHPVIGEKGSDSCVAVPWRAHPIYATALGVMGTTIQFQQVRDKTLRSLREAASPAGTPESIIAVSA